MKNLGHVVHKKNYLVDLGLLSRHVIDEKNYLVDLGLLVRECDHQRLKAI
jgi:hypothetical protein